MRRLFLFSLFFPSLFSYAAEIPNLVCVVSGDFTRGSMVTYTAQASGGDGKYVFNWSDGSHGPSTSKTVLYAGIVPPMSITVIDSNGTGQQRTAECKKTVTTTPTNPKQPQKPSVICSASGPEGKDVVLGSTITYGAAYSGDSPETYLWTTGETTKSITVKTEKVGKLSGVGVTATGPGGSAQAICPERNIVEGPFTLSCKPKQEKYLLGDAVQYVAEVSPASRKTSLSYTWHMGNTPAGSRYTGTEKDKGEVIGTGEILVSSRVTVLQTTKYIPDIFLSAKDSTGKETVVKCTRPAEGLDATDVFSCQMKLKPGSKGKVFFNENNGVHYVTADAELVPTFALKIPGTTNVVPKPEKASYKLADFKKGDSVSVSIEGGRATNVACQIKEIDKKVGLCQDAVEKFFGSALSPELEEYVYLAEAQNHETYNQNKPLEKIYTTSANNYYKERSVLRRTRSLAFYEVNDVELYNYKNVFLTTQRDEISKIRDLYLQVTNKIKYCEAGSVGLSLKDAVTSGKGVCRHIANALVEALKAADINARLVVGTGKNAGHVWVEVTLANALGGCKTIQLDPTHYPDVPFPLMPRI